MKKINNTLYVTTEDVYLALDGGNIVLRKENNELGRVPLHNLQSIVCFSYYGTSPALMGACAQREIDLCFLTPHGKFLARTCGATHGNVILRKDQYSICNDEKRASEIASAMIFAKLYNGRWLLERTVRDHPLATGIDKIKKSSEYLSKAAKKAALCTSIQTLRGIEGDAAAEYFGTFKHLILRPDECFKFSGRNRRPPLDAVNAMLSFAYVLLAGICSAALESFGLDPYVGVMHSVRPGRESFALDLMEEVRPVMADRFVLSCINNRIVNGKMFEKSESGAVTFNELGRKTFLSAWQEKKFEYITHPFIKEKIQWGMVPFIQAQLLSRYIRGDIDAYPPFLWK